MENLEKLNGVGKTTADKLKNKGFNTIEVIAKANPADLVQKIGVFPAVAKRIVASAKKITEARIREEETIPESEDKGEVEEEKEEEKEEKEEIEEAEGRKEGGEKPEDKIPLSETHIPVLVERLKKNEDLFEKVLQETAKSAASYIKETPEFREKFLNAAIKNMNFRQRLVNHIAKNMCDD